MHHRDTETQREEINALSHQVIGFCLEIHRELGPGLLESVYEEALGFELRSAGRKFERQRYSLLCYKGVKLDCGYRLDFLVEDKLILELKSVGELLPIHQVQLLTYLKLERRSVGLLINFNTPVLINGVHRVVCGELFARNEGPGAER